MVGGSVNKGNGANTGSNIRTFFLIMVFVSMAASQDKLVQLPESAGVWTRTEALKRVTEKTIFEYMDGAGELYIGYRFDRLDVATYQAPEKEDISAELYWMESSDDAFGLLSLDWSGESVFSPVNLRLDSNALMPIPPHRCLYAAGLLRLWSGRLYARILAFPETPESREAVMQIGRALMAGQEHLPPPRFISVLPPRISDGWLLESNQVSFLRTHLVLNSVYFLSFSNILNLDLSCAAATGRYRQESGGLQSGAIQVIAVEYPDSKKALLGLAKFHKAYFPEAPTEPKSKWIPGTPLLVRTETGFSGYVMLGRYAALGFDLPDEKTGESVLHEMLDRFKNLQ